MTSNTSNRLIFFVLALRTVGAHCKCFLSLSNLDSRSQNVGQAGWILGEVWFNLRHHADMLGRRRRHTGPGTSATSCLKCHFHVHPR